MGRYASLSFALLLLLVLLPLLCAPTPCEAKKKKKKVSPKKKKNNGKKKKNNSKNKSNKKKKKKKPTPKPKKKKKPKQSAKKRNKPLLDVCKKCTPGRCKGGLTCLRGLCVVHKGRGSACAPPCRACKSGLVCRNGGKCLEAASAVLIDGPNGCLARCTRGAECKLGLGCIHSRCKKVKVAGQSCGKSCDSCTRGTVCTSGTCSPLKKGLCGGCSDTSGCVFGLVCASNTPGKGKVCSKVVPNYERCNKGCVACRSGVPCERDGFCGGMATWGQCKKCYKGRSACHEGLDCRMSSPAHGRCVKRVPLDAECDNVCTACEDPLECREGKCELRGKKQCGQCQTDSDCQVGLACKKIGSGFGSCALPKDRGAPCNDPCLTCKEGLVCRVGEKCDLPRSALCESCGSDSDCALGLYCKGSSQDGDGRCAAPQIVGGDCSTPCNTCHPGATCSASGKCEELKGKWCTDCKMDEDCAEGLVCKDDKVHQTKKCARPMSAGQSCDEACWGCRTGLSCMEGDRGRMCVKRKAGICDACDRDENCRSGMTCKQGSDGRGKCAQRMGRGASCSDPCWDCEPGLTCSGGHTCMPETVGLCEVCEEDGDCAGELLCKKRKDGEGRCASPMGKGEQCSHKCWTCAEGLICNKLGKCE